MPDADDGDPHVVSRPDHDDAGLVGCTNERRPASKISVFRHRPTGPPRRPSASPESWPAQRWAHRIACPDWAWRPSTTTAPGPASAPGARDRVVGALHRLHGHDGLMLDDDGLADIEARQSRRPSDSQTPGPSAARRSSALRLNVSRLGEQRLQQLGRIEQLNATLLHDVGDGSDQRVGVARPQAGSTPTASSSPADDLEDFRVLDLPRHDGLRHTGLVEHLEARAEMAERNPMDGRIRACAAASSRSGKASSRTATMVTSWPIARAASSTRNGKSPVARDQPEFHRTL